MLFNNFTCVLPTVPCILCVISRVGLLRNVVLFRNIVRLCCVCTLFKLHCMGPRWFVISNPISCNNSPCLTLMGSTPGISISSIELILLTVLVALLSSVVSVISILVSGSLLSVLASLLLSQANPSIILSESYVDILIDSTLN